MVKGLFLCAAAATLCLGGASAVAQSANSPPPKAKTVPSSAQQVLPKSGPQHSTPAEEAQTYLLNHQAQSGFYAPPAVLNGKAAGGLERARSDTSRETRAYNQSQAEYQRAQHQYEQNLQKYQRERQAWQQSQRDYQAAITRFDQPKWAFHNYPKLVPVSFDASQLVPLDMLARPDHISGAPLQGPDGWEGWVVGWRSRPNGQRGLQVALNRHFAVWVPPLQVRFDQHRAVAVTSLNRSALWLNPGVYLKKAYDGGGD